MAAKSNYLRNKMIDLLFRGGTFTTPAGLYVGLFTTAPTDGGVGGTEVAGGSYARLPLAPSATNWQDTAGGTAAASTGTTGTTKNNVALTFAAPTANWGTIVGVGLWDAAVAGNLLAYGALSAGTTINTGGVPYSFPVASLTFQDDN